MFGQVWVASACVLSAHHEINTLWFTIIERLPPLEQLSALESSVTTTSATVFSVQALPDVNEVWSVLAANWKAI